ncbi:hypothetical protein JCM1840_004957, partial [Sporobolomyces johnsonii]
MLERSLKLEVSGHADPFKTTILEVTYMLQKAWKYDVKRETSKNCWKHAGILEWVGLGSPLCATETMTWVWGRFDKFDAAIASNAQFADTMSAASGQDEPLPPLQSQLDPYTASPRALHSAILEKVLYLELVWLPDVKGDCRATDGGQLNVSVARFNLSDAHGEDEDGTWHVCVTTSVLLHMTNVPQYITNIWRLLAQGGKQVHSGPVTDWGSVLGLALILHQVRWLTRDLGFELRVCRSPYPCRARLT